MTVNVEGIALCLWSSVEVVTFPFDAAPAGVCAYVLFETVVDIKKGKTTCLGHITEKCQKDFHKLLSEFTIFLFSVE